MAAGSGDTSAFYWPTRKQSPTFQAWDALRDELQRVLAQSAVTMYDCGEALVDVAVTLQGRNGPVRVAVEVQDSAIAVGELQRRNHADKRAGFFATVWVFTTNRLSRARGSLPEEVRYLDSRWRQPPPAKIVVRSNRDHR